MVLVCDKCEGKFMVDDFKLELNGSIMIFRQDLCDKCNKELRNIIKDFMVKE